MATDKKRYTLRVQDEVFEKIAYIAKKERRSIAMQMEYILSEYITEFEKNNQTIATHIKK